MNIRVLLLSLVIFTAVVAAAPLSIPPGPVTDCYVMTTDPGTYYLTGDLDCSGMTFMFVYDDDVIVDFMGYTISNGGSYGVNIDNSNNVVVRNGAIHGFETGVLVDPSPNAVIEDLTITGTHGDISVGVNITSSDNVTVQNCNITNLTYGVYADPSDNLLITNNRFYDMYYDSNGCAGVFFDAITNSVISDNWFSDTGDGIFIMGSTNIDVTGNEIYFVDSSKSLRGWGDALALEGNVDDILFQDNIVDNCISGYAIDLDDDFVPEQPANNLQVYDNYFGYDCYIYLDVGQNFDFRNIESHDGWYIYDIDDSTFEDITLSDCDDYMDIEYSDFNTFTNIEIWDIIVQKGMYLYESYDNTFTDVYIYNVPDNYCLDITDADRNTFENTWLYRCGNDLLYVASIADPNDFTDLYIGQSINLGLIHWPGVLSLTGVDLVDGTNIILAPDFVSLDDSDPNAAALDDTAFITLESVGPNPDYYVLAGFPLTRQDIIDNGVTFTPLSVVFVPRGVTFEVASFSSGYAMDSLMLPSGGGGSDRKELAVSMDTTCPGDVVELTVTHHGDPVENVEVQLALASPYNFIGTEDTDSDGKVEFTLSESGEYRATVDREGYEYMNPFTFSYDTCEEEEEEVIEEVPPEEEPPVEEPPAEEPPAEVTAPPEEPVEEVVEEEVVEEETTEEGEGLPAAAEGGEDEGEGAEQAEEAGFPWLLLLGILIVVGVLAYWFLAMGRKKR